MKKLFSKSFVTFVLLVTMMLSISSMVSASATFNSGLQVSNGYATVLVTTSDSNCVMQANLTFYDRNNNVIKTTSDWVSQKPAGMWSYPMPSNCYSIQGTAIRLQNGTGVRQTIALRW